MILILPAVISVSGFSADKPEKVMIRAEPAGKPIAVIKTDTPFEITEDAGEWVKVTVTGWVSRSELTATDQMPKTYPDQKIASPHGEFTITGVTFVPGEVGSQCSGIIRNTTGKSSTVVTYLLKCFSADGRQLESSYFTVNKLQKGKEKPFTVDLRYTRPHEIFTFTVSYETSF